VQRNIIFTPTGGGGLFPPRVFLRSQEMTKAASDVFLASTHELVLSI